MLSWQTVLLHCFSISPVTNEDQDTVMLGIVRVWGWKQLTDIDSLNKWDYTAKVRRFVSVCSSSRLLLFPSPPPGSRLA